MTDWGSDPEYECQECFHRFEYPLHDPEKCPKCDCYDLEKLT